MTTITQVIEQLEQHIPLNLQEPYDNCGLQVGDPDQPLTSILLTTDITESTIDEAIDLQANLIISHHPLIFSGIKRITGATYIERTIIRALRHGIVLYSAHTNADKIIGGVSYRMAQKLHLHDLRTLQPSSDGTGLGCIGHLSSPMTETDFLTLLKTTFHTPAIRHSRLLGKPIRTVALCGGSGAEFIPTAMHLGADIYITTDIKYHQFFMAENQLIIADIGHFESEQFTKEIFQEQLTDFFPNFAVRMASSDINPVKYY